MGDAWEGRHTEWSACSRVASTSEISTLSIIYPSAGRRPAAGRGGPARRLAWLALACRYLCVACVWRLWSLNGRPLELPPFHYDLRAVESSRARTYAYDEFGWLAASSQTEAGVGRGRSCCLAGVAPWRHASVPPLLGGAQCAGAPDGGVAGLRAMVVGYESGYGCSCSHSRAPAAKKACLFCRRHGGS